MSARENEKKIDIETTHKQFCFTCYFFFVGKIVECVVTNAALKCDYGSWDLVYLMHNTRLQCYVENVTGWVTYSYYVQFSLYERFVNLWKRHTYVPVVGNGIQFPSRHIIYTSVLRRDIEDVSFTFRFIFWHFPNRHSKARRECIRRIQVNCLCCDALEAGVCMAWCENILTADKW